MLRNLRFLKHDVWKFGENVYVYIPFKHKNTSVFIFRGRVQSLNKRTEVSFCPILIIECALKSWGPIEFKKINFILRAPTRHKIGLKSLPPRFWPFCVQNARKKKMTYLFEFYGTSAFQRTFDYSNWTKSRFCTIF